MTRPAEVAVYTITLARSGQTFEAEPGETIMDAAERAWVYLPHSCLHGVCRSCLTRILSGRVEHEPDHGGELNITAEEVEAGYRLLCSARPYSDVVLDR